MIGEVPAARAQTDPAGEDPTAWEAEAVAAARADRAGFAPLYAHYLDPVYRYCHRRLGDRQAAEDATALTFERALARLDRFAGGSFRTWLFAIAHNTVVDELRRRRPTAPLTWADHVPDLSPPPEGAALAEEERRSLRAVLPRLSEDQRRVVELHLAGLSGPEIAAVLGRNPAAIRAVQSRAVRRLRQLLRGPEGDRP